MEYIIKNKMIQVCVNEFGAELMSLKKVNEPFEYLWQGDSKYWGRRSPLLFPIVGKLKEDKYIYNNKKYHLSQHGFARDNEFTMEEYSENKLTFKFESNEDTFKNYPFKFELYITYECLNNGVKISYSVVNKDLINEMYFSIGAHPAFNWPLEKGKKENYYLEFDSKEILQSYRIKEDGISSKKENIATLDRKLKLNEELFKKDALIFDDIQYKTISYKNDIDSRAIQLCYDEFKYIGIWSKPEGAPFVCLEPWHGLADFQNHNGHLEDKEGILELKANGHFETSYTISIQ